MPTERDFRFVLVLDESGSMKGENKQRYALQVTRLFEHILSELKINHAVVGFSDSAEVHKGFDDKLTRKEDIHHHMQELEVAGGGWTDDLAGIELANDLLDSDKKKMVIGIGIGDGMQAVDSVYSHPVTVPNMTDLPNIMLDVLKKAMLGANNPDEFIIVITDGAGRGADTSQYIRDVEEGRVQ